MIELPLVSDGGGLSCAVGVTGRVPSPGKEHRPVHFPGQRNVGWTDAEGTPSWNRYLPAEVTSVTLLDGVRSRRTDGPVWRVEAKTIDPAHMRYYPGQDSLVWLDDGTGSGPMDWELYVAKDDQGRLSFAGFETVEAWRSREWRRRVAAEAKVAGLQKELDALRGMDAALSGGKP